MCLLIYYYHWFFMRYFWEWLRHLLLYVVIEVFFVLLIFHEIPHIDILSSIGLWHLSYWFVMIFFGVVRKYVHHVWQRFVATYFPLLFHVVVHLWIGAELIESYQRNDGSILWIIFSVIILGILIYIGELLLHRKYHCDSHHGSLHKDCMKKWHVDCEKEH